ncbi:MAG: hypothetical protein TR69_WS6001000853 [candidate division WS6 bacterium OLB20]|uniref:Uncharacterized protein n=1 Tax=candidate division WS6 bacterium OLB20 TaxID=1617426 RepID=A0A136LYT9_9BACT|nr:MAG: hypothetical protein TR69_WS6001000853 [candidate division WS6 bacterium OLB20]
MQENSDQGQTETMASQQQTQRARKGIPVVRYSVIAVLLIFVLVIIAGIVSGLSNTVRLEDSDGSCRTDQCIIFDAFQEDDFATWEVQPGWPLFLSVSGSAGNKGEGVTIRCPVSPSGPELMTKLLMLLDREAVQDCRVE